MVGYGHTMGPRVRYHSDLKQEHFQYDEAQALAVDQLQALYEQLVGKPEPTPLLQKINPWRQSARSVIKGLYFWGGVGRGKTYLMDAFYESLPIDQKLRLHFHHFMHKVHTNLQSLGETVNPLEKVADGFAQEARVLCFDEFFVSDIADAMILARLLEAMFSRGIVLVATSNVVPKNLYLNGLQRTKFLPAIDLIEEHLQVVQLDGGVDYRLRTLEQAEIYHYPLDKNATATLQSSFDALTRGEPLSREPLQINNRVILCFCEAAGVVWFDFAELCDGPRGHSDYIEIARCYHTVLLSNVPRFMPGQEDIVRRFIGLVDEFYDRQVKLIISAAVPMEQLYSQGNLMFEFQRTLSRLQEMQSHQYLASEHLP